MPTLSFYVWIVRVVARGAVTLAVFTAALAYGASLEVGESRSLFSEKWDLVNQAASHGQWDAYFTGYAWHLPYGYSNSTRSRLNETTWGGGFGRTVIDEDGDRHSVYLMAFTDSHRAPQLNLGYAWQRYWSPSRNVGFGFGYLLFVFSREDVANHLPMPALLPCASVRFGRLELIGLFVPRVSQEIKGDVLFVYTRLALGSTRRATARAGR